MWKESLEGISYHFKRENIGLKCIFIGVIAFALVAPMLQF